MLLIYNEGRPRGCIAAKSTHGHHLHVGTFQTKDNNNKQTRTSHYNGRFQKSMAWLAACV